MAIINIVENYVDIKPTNKKAKDFYFVRSASNPTTGSLYYVTKNKTVKTVDYVPGKTPLETNRMIGSQFSPPQAKSAKTLGDLILGTIIIDDEKFKNYVQMPKDLKASYAYQTESVADVESELDFGEIYPQNMDQIDDTIVKAELEHELKYPDIYSGSGDDSDNTTIDSDSYKSKSEKSITYHNPLKKSTDRTTHLDRPNVKEMAKKLNAGTNHHFFQNQSTKQSKLEHPENNLDDNKKKQPIPRKPWK